MKVTKKKLLTSLIATLVLSSAMGTAGLVYNAKAETPATNGVESFQMYYGASVRKTAGSLGIRFTATFDETLYNTVKADANKEFGMLITNNEWVEDYCTTGNYIDELVSDKNYILITESEATEGNALTPYKFSTNKETGAITYAINGVVANVQYTHSDWSWFGVGVIVTTNGAEKTYEYAGFETGANVRTVAEVASAALEYETNLSQTEKDNLMEYVYSAAYDAQGVSKTDYEALTKDDKADGLSGFTVSLDQTEYYATVGEKGTAVSATAKKGDVSFPVRAKWTSADDEIATVSKQGILTATGRGYTTLTATTTLGFNETTLTATAYTGETTLITQDMENAPIWAVAGQVSKSSAVGTIDGEVYNHSGTGVGTESNYFALVPSDISSNYLAYMKSQGYNWVRSRAYFTNDTADTIGFRIAANADSNGGTQRLNTTEVATNQWMSIDIPIDFYLGVYWNNGAGVTNGKAQSDEGFFMYTTVDEYGMLSMHSYNYRAPFVVTTYKTTSYFGDVTLIKESEMSVTVTENDVEAKFLEDYDLSKQFTVAESDAVYYTVEGKTYRDEAFLPVFKSHEVSIDTNVLKVDVTLPVAAASEIKFTKSTPTTATLNVTNGLAVTPVSLVNTEGTYDIDKLIGKTELVNAGLEAEYSIVKRYSDGTPMETLDVANAESGIYYYTVNVKKNGETLGSYETTIDLYKESEGCEYESFKHTDSQYAVKSYLGWMKGVWLTAGSGYRTISAGKVDSLMSDIWCVDYRANYDETKTNVAYAMGFGIETGAVGITNYETLTNVGYLDYNWTEKSAYEVFDSYTFDGSGGTHIFTYVLPRHSKLYYQQFVNTHGNFAMAFKGNNGITYANPINVENGAVTLRCQKVGSNNNQGTDLQKEMLMNIQTLVDNYDLYASEKIPMHITFGPASTSESSTIARLYEIFFVKNA